MCLSTHEMNSASLEEDIVALRKLLDSGQFGGRAISAYERRQWGWRVEEMEKILKERAEAGTYSNDFEGRAYR